MEIRILDETAIAENPYSRLIVTRKTTYHKHTFFEFSICIGGSMKNLINDTLYKIEKGRILLLRPDDKHYLYSDVPYSARDIYVSVPEMKSICDSIDETLFERLSSEPFAVNFDVSQYDLLSLENKLNYFNTRDRDPLSLKIRHRNIILQILDLWRQNDAEKSNHYPEWISLLLSRINTEKFLTQNVSEAIRSTNYSHGYVCREFKKYLGVTLQETLDEAKFSYAAALLADRDVSIAQISEKLNYSAPSNFIIAFKRHYGVTPSQWRKQRNIH